MNRLAIVDSDGKPPGNIHGLDYRTRLSPIRSTSQVEPGFGTSPVVGNAEKHHFTASTCVFSVSTSVG